MKKKVVKKQKSQTVEELSERMLDCSGLVSVICFCLIRQCHRVDLDSCGGLHLSQIANWPPYPNPWNKNRVVDTWSYRKYIFSHLFIKYLGTGLMPWSIRVAMRKTGQSQLPEGEKNKKWGSKQSSTNHSLCSYSSSQVLSTGSQCQNHHSW